MKKINDEICYILKDIVYFNLVHIMSSNVTHKVWKGVETNAGMIGFILKEKVSAIYFRKLK